MTAPSPMLTGIMPSTHIIKVAVVGGTAGQAKVAKLTVTVVTRKVERAAVSGPPLREKER